LSTAAGPGLDPSDHLAQVVFFDDVVAIGPTSCGAPTSSWPPTGV